VHWTPPAGNNGSAIVGYTVIPIRAGVAQPGVVFNSTATTQTVNGLVSGVSYSFRVAARNGNGTGTQSVLSNAVVPN
jgi:Fibronectin type III domain